MAATAPASGSVDLAAARVSDLHGLYGEAVYRYCRKRLRSHEDAEDATQIVFLNAHRALAQGVEPRSESAWLFKIAENVVLYRHRTSVRRARNEFPADTNDLHEIRQPVPDMRGVARDIAQALSKVPPSQQRAFVLREWQGLPYQAIAAELNVSVEAATALVVRARNNLSRELERPSRLRRAGSMVAWLLTPLERVISSGVVLKMAGGVAAVVIGVPAAETVIERHAAEARVPVSVTPVRAHAKARHGTVVRYTSRGVALPVRVAHAAKTSVTGARVHGSRIADVGGAPDAATPVVSAVPDAGSSGADAPAASDPAQTQSPAQVEGGAATDPVAPVADPPSGSTAPPPATGGAGHPSKRPTLPAKAKGQPPADPGSQSIPHAGDDGNAS